VSFTFVPNDQRNARHSHFVLTVGRLGPGVSLEQARTELGASYVPARRAAGVDPLLAIRAV